MVVWDKDSASRKVNAPNSLAPKASAARVTATVNVRVASATNHAAMIVVRVSSARNNRVLNGRYPRIRRVANSLHVVKMASATVVVRNRASVAMVADRNSASHAKDSRSAKENVPRHATTVARVATTSLVSNAHNKSTDTTRPNPPRLASPITRP